MTRPAHTPNSQATLQVPNLYIQSSYQAPQLGSGPLTGLVQIPVLGQVFAFNSTTGLADFLPGFASAADGWRTVFRGLMLAAVLGFAGIWVWTTLRQL